MNYEEFKEQLSEDLKQSLYESTGNEHYIDTNNVSKLQNESYEALTIRPETSPVAVSLDVQSLFAEYEKGRGYDDIKAAAVAMVNEGFSNQPTFNFGDFTNYDVMKEKLSIQVVATERNADMLTNIPHKEIEDMSLVCRFVIDTGSNGIGTILVNNGMLDTFGITPEQLFDDAVKYAPEIKPTEIRDMMDIVIEQWASLGMDISEIEGARAAMKNETPLYVATTTDKTNGAGIIAYPGFMDAAAEKVGGDFFILPSSVHEIIIVPDKGDSNYRDLEAMVREVNATEVRPQDRLSDHVYHYDSKDKVFELAEKFEARMAAKEKVAEKGSVLKELSDQKKEAADKPKVKNEKTPKKGEASL